MQIKNFFEKVAIVIAVLIGSFALVLVLAIILINISLKPKPSSEAKQVVLADTGDEYLIDVVPSIKEGEFYKLFGQSKNDLIGKSDRLFYYDDKSVIKIFSEDWQLIYYYLPASNELFIPQKNCDIKSMNAMTYVNSDLGFQVKLPQAFEQMGEMVVSNQGNTKSIVLKGDTSICGSFSAEHLIHIERNNSLEVQGLGLINDDTTLEEYISKYHARYEVFDNGEITIFIYGTSNRPSVPQPYEAWAVNSAGNIFKIKFNGYFDNLENIKTILSTFQSL